VGSWAGSITCCPASPGAGWPDSSGAAQWRFAVTDTDGRLVFGGLTRRRPFLAAGRPPGTCRGGIVELRICAELLAALTGGGPGGLPVGLSRWAPVLADIAAQYADRARLPAQLDTRPRDRFPHPGLNRSTTPATTPRAGPTTQANTAPLCPSHHHRKTTGGWKLHQTRPGLVTTHTQPRLRSLECLPWVTLDRHYGHCWRYGCRT
jgi:hypothetical protein